LLIAQSLGFGFDLYVNTSPSNGRAEEGPQVKMSDDGCDKIHWNKLSLGRQDTEVSTVSEGVEQV
jgi:hypothetical protein